MFLVRKLFNGLTLRCCAAIALGMMVVTVIASTLFALSGGSDIAPREQSAAYTINFPEDEQSLEAMSAQVLQNAEMAAQAPSLANIEPVAGMDSVDGAADPTAKTPLADQLFAPEKPATPTGESAGDDLNPTLH